MLDIGQHPYKCKHCHAKVVLDIFPQPYMTVTQNEYAEKLYEAKLCNKCYLDKQLTDELEKSNLEFAVDRNNFIRGWGAREKYDNGYKTGK